MGSNLLWLTEDHSSQFFNLCFKIFHSICLFFYIGLKLSHHLVATFFCKYLGWCNPESKSYYITLTSRSNYLRYNIIFYSISHWLSSRWLSTFLYFFFVNTQTLCTNQKGYKSKLINEINFCNAWFVTTKVSSTALLTGSPFFFKCPCVQISTLVIAEGVSLTLIYKLTYSAQDYQHKINYLLILWKLNQINLQQIIYHLIL